jgi:hypothetical protein
LVDKFGVSLKIFTRLTEMMEDECVDLKESIINAIKEMRKKKAETKAGSKTPTSTPSQSRSASPTKSALRNAHLTPSLTSSSTKRKVAFSISDASVSEDDSVFAPETPSKRPRRTPRTSSAARELPVRTRASSASSEDVEMPDVLPSLLLASEPVAGPSTPRTPKTVPTHAYRTPPSARIQALSFLSDEEEEADVEETAAAVAEGEAGEEEALPLSRRFRPVFLDRAQWAQRAPRLARDRAIAEKRMKDLVERWGYPFEALRRTIAVTAPG